MAEIGVRELKAHATEIIRSVREQKVRYTVTYRGRPVGILMPIGEAPRATDSAESSGQVWSELTRLGRAIGEAWTAPGGSTELLADMRR